MDTVLYSSIPFVIFLVLFGIYSFYKKIKDGFEKILQQVDLLSKGIIEAKEDHKKIYESIENIENQLLGQQKFSEKIGESIANMHQKINDDRTYSDERFKYLLTDSKQIIQLLQEYRREILLSQASNPRIENDISKVTDDTVDLSDEVTPFPMHDTLKVQIDDGPAMPLHITQNIPSDDTLPEA